MAPCFMRSQKLIAYWLLTSCSRFTVLHQFNNITGSGLTEIDFYNDTVQTFNIACVQILSTRKSFTDIPKQLTERKTRIYKPASSTVSGRHNPLIVDETSTTEMSFVNLQRYLPWPAVRHRFHSTDHTHAHAGWYRRHAAGICKYQLLS